MNRVLPSFIRAAGILFIAATLAEAGVWPAAVPGRGSSGLSGAGAAAPAGPWQMPAVMVQIGAQVSGSVLKVNAGDRRYVTAGAALVELDPTPYRAAVARARAQAAALSGEVRAAQTRVAWGRRQAAGSVSAVVGRAAAPVRLPAPPPLLPALPTPDPAATAAAAQAQEQIVAARSQVLSNAQSEAVSAGQVLDRDRTLLAQGLVAAQQIDADTAAYNAAQAQVAAARTALHTAQAGSPRPGVGSVAQAQAQIATAQRNLGAAQKDAAAATAVVNRDSALAAQGAVAARQVTADAVAQDAAKAREAAATAELRRAQAELTAAHAETAAQAAAAAAARRQTEWARQAAALQAQHTAQTRALAQQAASTIVAAAGDARALAALETQAVNAQTAVRRAEADLAATTVRAPVDGWIVEPIVRPSERVRQGQSGAVLAVEARPRGPATASRGGASSSASGAAGSPDASTLARITANERSVLAELSAEAARISSLSAGGVPGTAPGAYGTANGFNQAGGEVPTLLNGGMPWPVMGAITSGYGWRIHPIFDAPEFHTGVDIAASTGTPIEAPAAGTVIFAGALPANGTLVILDHGNGVTTTYSHLSSYRVYVGEHVQRGEVIAQVGSTGWSTGPHLFFEIRKNGHPVDPLSQ